MEGIMELLQGEIGQTLLSGAARETGQSEEKTGELLQMALPILLGAMKKNTRSPKGAEGLLSALENKHDGGILDHLGTLFEGGYTEETLKDGQGIIGHVLGGKEEGISRALGQKVGMNGADVAKILQMVAPILLGFLGKKKRSQGVGSSAGLDDLLGGLLGTAGSGGEQGLIEAFLDSDGDVNVVDDLAGMLLKNKGKEGLGGLLGGLFEK